MSPHCRTVTLLCSAAFLVWPAVAQSTGHELLNSTLWTQTSVEHDAAYVQAYRQARESLDRALKDRKWTAALEQTKGYRKLKPAVILDVDETIIDNSAVEAEVIRRGGAFNPALWDDWVRREQGTPLPGALEFTKYAASKNVEVIYLTNRNSSEKEATRKMLTRWGFPLNTKVDTIYCRGDKPEWTSEKSSRRIDIATRYRILLLLGDDLGDFLPGVRVSPQDRQKLASTFSEHWGVRWILLPNAMYGTWEGALYQFDATISHEEQLRRKNEYLRPFEAPKLTQ